MESGTTSLEDNFFGSVTVGERGQIVIPAEARKRLNISTGDKLLVMQAPSRCGLIVCSIDSFREFISRSKEGLDRIEGSDSND